MTPNLRLVVALGVCNSLFPVPSVYQCVRQRTHVPLRVLFLLKPLDVEVRYGHCKTIVEADPSK